MTHITIAIDAMGGDFGLPVTVPAAKDILRDYPDVSLILVGDEVQLKTALKNTNLSLTHPRLCLQHASQIVEMTESPQSALKSKKDSSMRVAINLVKEGRAQAAVSAGNTGALMATARFVLKTLPGIDRPAIITAFPTQKKSARMLDLGANVACTPEQLFQFAVMGSVLCEALDNNPSPTIGLLNIGSEAIKGNELVQETAKLLEHAKGLNYFGFVEGDDLYKGTVDVIVCDGFVGNIALKTSEGLARMLADILKKSFKRNLLTKLAAIIAWPVLVSIKKQMDPRRYNGATFIGLKGVVVKSHGGTDVLGFEHAIREAIIEARTDVPSRIQTQVTKKLGE